MSFNPLDHPEILAEPEWLQDPGGWMQHIPFAFLIMKLTMPRNFVELGTHSGNSYCAFCQGAAMANTHSQCSAVDTWKGDRHSYEYPEQIFEQLSRYHAPRYGAFSQLLRMTFDEALEKFEERSIDLLHIDGLHTYEAVKHDFETWLPKMSDRGAVMFHDSAIYTSDFGVHQLMAELKPRFPHFQFEHGFGLSIFLVGDKPPAGLLQFITDANARPQETRALFHTLGRTIFELFLKRSLTLQMLQVRQAIINWEQVSGIPINTEAIKAQPVTDPQTALRSIWQQLEQLRHGLRKPQSGSTGPNFSIGRSG